MGFVSAIGSQNLNMSVGGINGYFSTMQCSQPESKIYSEKSTLKP